MPLPKCDLPWGLCQAWQSTGALVLGINDKPIVSMIGEKRKELVILTPNGPILSLSHIYDSDGNELVQDKEQNVKYTVLLNRKNMMPSMASGDDDGEVRDILFFYINYSKNGFIFRVHYYLSLARNRRPTRRPLS